MNTKNNIEENIFINIKLSIYRIYL